MSNKRIERTATSATIKHAGGPPLIRQAFDARKSQPPAVASAPVCGYTPGMKTAISIPDDVFEDAEALARATRQSRSQLYSRAVREYVARHAPDSVTAALDTVCAELPPDAGFATAAARRTLERSEW
ncbi:MAG TPA: hypothetical protein VFH17_01850 [Coriobacteriia bacterium]|nr:hypothetical protein [Coriobacteriia bacterium]